MDLCTIIWAFVATAALGFASYKLWILQDNFDSLESLMAQKENHCLELKNAVGNLENEVRYQMGKIESLEIKLQDADDFKKRIKKIEKEFSFKNGGVFKATEFEEAATRFCNNNLRIQHAEIFQAIFEGDPDEIPF